MSPHPKGRQYRTVDQQLDAVFEEFLCLSNLSDHGTSDLVPDMAFAPMVPGVVGMPTLRSKGLPSNFNSRHDSDVELEEKHSKERQSAPADSEAIEMFVAEGATSATSSTSSTSSLGVSDEQIQETASAIAHVGDELEREYGATFSNARQGLLPYFDGSAGQLHYEVFAGVLNELIGQDRSVGTFAMVMHLGKDIMQNASGARDVAHGMFKQFLKDAFCTVVEEKGSVTEYAKTLQKK